MKDHRGIIKPIRNYDCCLLAQGFDTLEESASVFVFPQTWERLDERKQYAKEMNKGDNQAYPVKLGGMEFLINPNGGNGVAFILTNPNFTICIRPAKIDYNLSVKYSSAVLWQYGVKEARRMIWATLLDEMKQRPVYELDEHGEPVYGEGMEKITKPWRKVSRADYAFDFHSQEFTGEFSHSFVGQIVCHSSIKSRVDFKVSDDMEGYIMGTSSRAQTLTIGSKQRLQIQIYNKSEEITEKSKKTWMYKIWGDYKQDVWRLEVRMMRNFLNEEGIDTFEELELYLSSLLVKALGKRVRLCDRSDTDSNRRRWATHPLWYEAIEYADDNKETHPIGRQVERASEIITKEAVRDMKAAMRRFCVSTIGEWDAQEVSCLVSQILVDFDQLEDEHKEHTEAMERYQAKYAHMNEPH